MRITILLLIFCSYYLPAQVNVIIEDQTDQGFFLGINGFLQNTEKSKGMVIKKLDTIPYLLHIDCDAFSFKKTIHLRETGTHKFVLVRNFKGSLKLRYRGEREGIPADYPSLAFSRAVPWPEELAKDTLPITEEPLTAAVQRDSVDPMNTAVEIVDDTAIITIDPAAVERPRNILLPGNDTVQGTGRTIEVSEPEYEASDFDRLLEDLKKTDFEFERLLKSQEYVQQNVIMVEQLKEVFALLRYDNSRVQLFKSARKNISDPRNIGKLKQTLEYETSKRQFENMIDEK